MIQSQYKKVNCCPIYHTDTVHILLDLYVFLSHLFIYLLIAMNSTVK